MAVRIFPARQFAAENLDKACGAAKVGVVMKPAGPLKLILSAFTLAVLVYAVALYAIEHRRHEHGPWQADLCQPGAARPRLIW